MVHAVVPNISIRGISATVPHQSRPVLELGNRFDPGEVHKISESTGVQRAYIADQGICTSDLCTDAARRLLQQLDWDPSTIGLLVFVTQNPDYVFPATGGVVHGWLGLPKTTLTIDVSQGCSGFVTGLWTASSLLSQMSSTRALLLAGDLISNLVSEDDCGSRVLFGDAGTATAIEVDLNAKPMIFVGGSDGTGACHLRVPTGGFRQPRPVNDEESITSNWGLGRLSMNGPEVFAFASREVPPLVKETLTLAGWSVDDVDQFLFHQANQYLNQHLIRKLKIPAEKAPSSLANYGNTSSASIPLTLVSTQRTGQYSGRTLMAGFGVGLSWAACAAHFDSVTLAGVEPLKCKP